MANEEQLKILRQGVDVWNAWRREHLSVASDLCGADLRGANLSGVSLSCTYLAEANLAEANLTRATLTLASLTKADLRHADLTGANLRKADFEEAIITDANLARADLTEATLRFANLAGADLRGANLAGADLTGASLAGADLTGASLFMATLAEAGFPVANLTRANLTRANLTRANLFMATLAEAIITEADLSKTDLHKADLTRADLTRADLRGADLIETTLDHTILTGSKVYGLSIWDMQGTPADQSSLVITPPDVPTVTVDDLEVAQFIYLLLNREKLRNVINTITSKAVLILGRFTSERKVVLDALADEVRTYNLLPIIFDFERATTRDFTETIKTLAGLSLFVIADITNPKSAPLELQATVPDYQIPFIAVMQEGEQPFSMFSDLPKYPWVLEPVIRYPSVAKLIALFKEGILDPAWEKHQQLMEQKGKAVKS